MAEKVNNVLEATMNYLYSKLTEINTEVNEAKNEDKEKDNKGNDKNKKSEKNQPDGKNKTDQSKKTNNTQEPKVINILLLGATGVGKSTFINSIVNYLQHKNYSEAEKHDLTMLIPSTFTVYNKFRKPSTFTVGSTNDKTEFLEVGVSATQCVRTYTFKIIGGLEVRLIDTPGMGDTRGIDQDNDNCEQILSYISKLYHLHAICFLFKSQESRSTVYFKYCMAQIMSRLEKSACKNIIFIFTNSSGHDFTPGNTLELLKQQADEIKKNQAGAELRVDFNTFCVDNKALAYLSAAKKGIQVDGDAKNDYIKSWNKSTDECWKLIGYIQKLRPHYVQHTNAINEARRMIYQLSRPMAEITQLINDNITRLQRHQNELDFNKDNINELKKKLYIPVIKLDVIKVTQPITVCTDLKCTEICMIDNMKEVNYVTKCHDPCYLNNVPKDVLGSPELMHCHAMNGNPKQACNVCGCSYKLHMHIYYLTKKVNATKVDDQVSKGILKTEDVIKKAAKIIIDMNTRLTELQSELNKIVNYNAKFSYFLQCNAIAPFSDSYAAYIEHLILTENRLDCEANTTKLDGLKKLLREHNELKTIFAQEAEKQNKLMAGSGLIVTPREISANIAELYQLKHFGKKIKELVEAQNQAMKKEYSVTEYKHSTIFSQAKGTKNHPRQFVNKNYAPKNDKPQQGKPKSNQNQRGSNQQGQQHKQNIHAANVRSNSPPPAYDKLGNDSNQNRSWRPNNYNHPPGAYGGFNPDHPQPFQAPSYPYPKGYYEPSYGPYPGYYPPPPPPPHQHPPAPKNTDNKDVGKNVEISVKIVKSEDGIESVEHVPKASRDANTEYNNGNPDPYGRYPPHPDYPPRGYGSRDYPYHHQHPYHPYPHDYYQGNPNNRPPNYGPNYAAGGYYGGPGPSGGYPGEHYGPPRGYPSDPHYRPEHWRDSQYVPPRDEHRYNLGNRPSQFNAARGNSEAPPSTRVPHNDFINKDLSQKLAGANIHKQGHHDNKNRFKKFGNRRPNKKYRNNQSADGNSSDSSVASSVRSQKR